MLDLEKLKQDVKDGANINELHNGVSYLHDYLDIYYQEQVYGKINEDDDYDYPYPEELTLPLALRKYDIFSVLEWFFENDTDPNAGEETFPLMRAVGNADAAMTEYLLEHGASPFYEEKAADGINVFENWYFEELDIQMLNESFVTEPDHRLMDAIRDTAVVLAKHGVTGVGHCVTIDNKTRKITAQSAKVKY